MSLAGCTYAPAHLLKQAATAKACMLTCRCLQHRCGAAQAATCSQAHLVDTRHHCKDGRVCDGGGWDPRCSQLPGVLMAPISGCPLSNHHLHAGGSSGCTGRFAGCAILQCRPAVWLANSHSRNPLYTMVRSCQQSFRLVIHTKL